MEIQDEQTIQAPLLKVWEALNDPLVLRQCIPGCDQMEKISDSEFRLGMLAVVGPVKARFTGKLLLQNIDAPNSYTLNFEGAGGAAGFGKGSASVALSAEGSALTKLKYAASAQVGGKLAQVGSRLIDGIARKIAADFFIKFGALLAAEAPAAETVAETDSASAPPVPSIAKTSGASKKWTLAILLLLIACAGLALSFR